MNLTLLRALRRSGKQKLYIIPYLFTFANALCGFLAVIKALEGDYTSASFCIILAGCMDLVDGRLARAFGSSSSLGMELDSLCDAVSFCLAPTIVLYSWKFYAFGVVGIITLALYLCAGLFRLAKFNCMSFEQGSYFSGLPTPLAALSLVSLVIHDSVLTATPCSSLMHGYVLLAISVLLAFLMISPIRFPAYKKMRISKGKACIGATAIMLLVGWSLAHDYPTLCVLVVAYIVSSCCGHLYRTLSKFKSLT